MSITASRQRVPVARKILAILAFCLATLVLLWFPFFFERYVQAQCTSSAFAVGWWGAPGSLVVGIVVASIVAAMFLFNVIWVSPRFILLPIAELAIPVGLCFYAANYYSCFAPTAITWRSGYLTAPRTLHWSDVREVRAWCWKSQPRYGAAYLGATLGLYFDDGLELPFFLGNDPHPSSNNYWMVKESLAGVDYQFVLDPTVTADTCPSALYPLLEQWAAN